MSSAASEVTWIFHLLEDLGVHNLTPIALHCDNISAMHIAHNRVQHERTKHISIDYHFTREKILNGLLQLKYLPTSQQLADMLTKVLPSTQLQPLLSKLGMYFPTPSLRGMIIYQIYNRLTLILKLTILLYSRISVC